MITRGLLAVLRVCTACLTAAGSASVSGGSGHQGRQLWEEQESEYTDTYVCISQSPVATETVALCKH